MYAQKPRVSHTEGATSIRLEWQPVPGATAYRARYTRRGTSDVLSIRSVVSTHTTFDDLDPATEYTAYVSAVVITRRSAEAVVYFKTSPMVLSPSLGSGEEVFAALPIQTYTYSLAGTSLGYAFDASRPGLFVDGRFYQFATFFTGSIQDETHVDFTITHPTGNWIVSEDPSRYFDHTLLYVCVHGRTGWLDSNRLRIPGVIDVQDGGRALERSPSTRPASAALMTAASASLHAGDTGDEQRGYAFRTTFSSLVLSGDVYVRLGIPDDGRRTSGVRMVHD